MFSCWFNQRRYFLLCGCCYEMNQKLKIKVKSCIILNYLELTCMYIKLLFITGMTRNHGTYINNEVFILFLDKYIILLVHSPNILYLSAQLEYLLFPGCHFERNHKGQKLYNINLFEVNLNISSSFRNHCLCIYIPTELSFFFSLVVGSIRVLFIAWLPFWKES